MLHNTLEITREYRLDFEVLEADWDDPMLPEVTSRVLGRKTTFTMTRTSLLAWSLMDIAHVEMADLTGAGWIKIIVSTGPDFDEQVFRSEVADVLARVKSVRNEQQSHVTNVALPTSLKATIANVVAVVPAARRGELA
jgi:isopropylmalate/homocitrate/citramalate synthase